MCGCLILLLGAFTPRLALAIIALVNDEISESFDGGILLPFLGFLFLPYTTLTYVLLHWWGGDVTGIEWFFVGFAFLVDVSSYFGGWRKRADVVRYRRA
ncbi:MAG: hypothetical protein ACRD0A_13755 [Acidimicrobiales bacterium]